MRDDVSRPRPPFPPLKFLGSRQVTARALSRQSVHHLLYAWRPVAGGPADECKLSALTHMPLRGPRRLQSEIVARSAISFFTGCRFCCPCWAACPDKLASVGSKAMLLGFHARAVPRARGGLSSDATGCVWGPRPRWVPVSAFSATFQWASWTAAGLGIGWEVPHNEEVWGLPGYARTQRTSCSNRNRVLATSFPSSSGARSTVRRRVMLARQLLFMVSLA